MLLLESQFLERKTDEMKVSRVARESLKNKNLIDIDTSSDQKKSKKQDLCDDETSFTIFRIVVVLLRHD